MATARRRQTSRGRPNASRFAHVHRVARRLGLVPDKSTAEQAHVWLEALVPPDLVYPFHIQLIKHGRRTCHAQRPKCDVCPLRKECPSAAVFQPGLAKSPD
ncbi:MAG: hypothetical protein WEE64_11405 [Dehalococcoidia bacterium]